RGQGPATLVLRRRVGARAGEVSSDDLPCASPDARPGVTSAAASAATTRLPSFPGAAASWWPSAWPWRIWPSPWPRATSPPAWPAAERRLGAAQRRLLAAASSLAVVRRLAARVAPSALTLLKPQRDTTPGAEVRGLLACGAARRGG